MTDQLTPAPALLDPPQDVTVSRIIPASAERVFAAWTKPDLLREWWAPAGSTVTRVETDARVGGTTLLATTDAEGTTLVNTWKLLVVDPAVRLEFEFDWADETGARIDPTTLGLPPELPRDIPHLLVFEAIDDTSSRLTVTEHGFPTQAMVDGSREALGGCFDRFTEVLARG